MDKIEQIQWAIDKGSKRISKLNTDALNVPSMTSLNIRHLLNNLGAISTNFLEIGSHVGGTYCSTVFGNHNLENATAIDNYSEFNRSGNTKQQFLDNAREFTPPNTKYSLIEKDCFTVKDFFVKYDLYAYDGQHTESSQQRAVTHFLPYLTDEFIFLVDDWTFNGVESGTRNGIKLAGLEILFEQIFVTPEGGLHNDHWHNGYSVFLLKQHK